MNKNEISTENLNKPISKTASTKFIRNQVIHINGRGTFRGTPSSMSNPEAIGEDGKENKYTISTAESFKIDYRDEGKQEINTFYVTNLIYELIGRLAKNIDELFEQGKQTGPVVICKTQGSKQPYWNLLSEADFMTSEKVVKE